MKNLGQVTENLDIPKKSDIPTKTSQLTNDSGFLTSAPVTSVNGQTGAVTLALGETNVQADWSVTSTSSDAYIKNKPTSLPASDVSAWAKASSKPTYTASEVGALPTTTTYAGSASVGGPATSANKVNSALTITNGSTSITYDGSSAKSITIQAGGSGGVTSVVGQTGDVTASQIKSGIQTSSGGFAIGTESSAGSGFAGGAYSSASDDSVAIGNSAGADSTAVAIGYEAVASDENAIQLGTGTNANADTLQFKSYRLVNANGYVPVARNSIAQTTYSNLTSNNTVKVLFTGTVSSGNISISGGKALKDYRMIFILGSNAYNNGTEWFTFYGWQFAYMVSVGSSYINSVKICSSDNYGFWNVSLASLSSTTTISTLGTNMKIYRILGVD